MYTVEEIASFKWTWAKVDALETKLDFHTNSCEDCERALEAEPLDNEHTYFCPIGESLLEESAEALCQWSWQPDFDPSYLDR